MPDAARLAPAPAPAPAPSPGPAQERRAGVAAGGPRRAAFFDVDETLVGMKTMAAFLDHAMPADGGRWDGFVGSLPTGLPREEVNRRYYRLWRGRRADDLLAEGRRWWASVVDRPGLFLPDACAALAAHARAGDLVVLVSGSFPAPLRPVADHLGADAVLCTEPASEGGVLTGEIGTPMIGAGKAEAVRAFAAARGLDTSACSAYGDHVTDVPMLAAVGRPRPVGDDPSLREEARRRGWI